jgi:hypothetical protein
VSARRMAAPCGTNAAYQRHLWHGQTPCPRCRDAHTAYMRARRTGATTKTGA